MTPLKTNRMKLVSAIYLRSLQTGKNKLAFLPVSKARTNKFDIFRQFTYMVYFLHKFIYFFAFRKTDLKRHDSLKIMTDKMIKGGLQSRHMCV